MVRSHSYTSDIALIKAFLFGHKFEKDGFAYVGSGEDDDPFIIGITSLAMIDSALKFASTSTFTLFHADATFKLSDIGYPVISCGFTDQARSYQLGALFVVSRQSAYEYGECFRSFAQLVRSLRGRDLRIDANMGDAEDAQFLALSSVPEFAEATVLMCFFHVLYNVRKKTQHFLPADRYTVMRSIMDMHYCSSQHEYDLYEWIKGRFWRWQVYQTPQGYATTNNPCETFNAVIKAFVQRRRYHMRLLLQKLVDLIETLEPKQPVTSDYVAVPTTELVKAAVSMMDSNRVTVQNTDNSKCVYVKELRAGVRQEDVEDHEEALEQFSIAFGDSESLDQTDEENWNEPVVTDPDVVLTGVDNVDHTNDLVARLHPCTTECEQEDVPAKARELETQAVKWPLRRAHRLGIPDQGWIVDLERRQT
ncbi:hypothetical protein PR002_g25227 [Phytophthora rubi]|uniref:MULE transposase domain-containing protein n=1 Tax=Phytophthora rubi TaxID=129364 RepID=A0A6A3I3G1_9STRA|nr:hypothetical protein PR002_g25227 [Phytophthora rubi]